MIDAATVLDGSVLIPISVVCAALGPPLGAFIWLNKRLGKIDNKLDRLDTNHITREMMLDWIIEMRDDNPTLKVPRFPGRQPENESR